jgi:hypothetical protein
MMNRREFITLIGGAGVAVHRSHTEAPGSSAQMRCVSC